MTYFLSRRLQGTISDIDQRVRAALKEEGFGILTEIDIQETLKEKLGIQTRAHRILGACNPPFAHEALTQEPEIATLLPCNVTLRETEDGVILAAVDPHSLVEVTGNDALGAVADEIHDRLVRVLDAVAKA